MPGVRLAFQDREVEVTAIFGDGTPLLQSSDADTNSKQMCLSVGQNDAVLCSFSFNGDF